MTGDIWAGSGWGSTCRDKPFSTVQYKLGRKDVSSGANNGEELKSSYLILVFDISGSQMSLEACSYLLKIPTRTLFLCLMWHLLYNFNVCKIAQFPQAHYLTSPRSQSHPPRKYIKWNVTATEGALGRHAVSLENPWVTRRTLLAGTLNTWVLINLFWSPDLFLFFPFLLFFF